MAIRAVPVPAYTTNTPEDHAHLLLDSGARAAIVSTAALGARVAAGAALVGGLDAAVLHGRRAAARPFATAARPTRPPPDDIAAEAEPHRRPARSPA